MPVAKDGNLKTMSLVVTRDQADRLHALHARRQKKYPHSQVSISDIAREVIDKGLQRVVRTDPDAYTSQSGDSIIVASHVDGSD